MTLCHRYVFWFYSLNIWTNTDKVWWPWELKSLQYKGIVQEGFWESQLGALGEQFTYRYNPVSDFLCVWVFLFSAVYLPVNAALFLWCIQGHKALVFVDLFSYSYTVLLCGCRNALYNEAEVFFKYKLNGFYEWWVFTSPVASKLMESTTLTQQESNEKNLNQAKTKS